VIEAVATTVAANGITGEFFFGLTILILLAALLFMLRP